MVGRIGAVIAPVDGFTGKRITDQSLVVRSGNGQVPVKKAEGYYVLWEDGNPWLTVTIECMWFERITVTVHVLNLRKKAEPVYHVYLVPSALYPFPAYGEMKGGMAQPGGVTLAALEDTDRLLRIEMFLTWGENKLPAIRIKNHYGLLLEDRLLYLLGENGEGELCHVGVYKKESETIYLLSPLRRSYREGASKLLLVYRSKADESGSIKVPGEYRICEQEELIWDFAYAREQF